MEAKALIEKDINAQNFKEVIEVCDIVPEKETRIDSQFELSHRRSS